jgi:alcohol dehydrogenase (cytochrome c)
MAVTIAGPAMAQKAAPTHEFKLPGVTWEDILSDERTNDNVLQYGLGVRAQRFSTLDQINADNAKRLVPKWVFSFGDERVEGGDKPGQWNASDLLSVAV